MKLKGSTVIYVPGKSPSLEGYETERGMSILCNNDNKLGYKANSIIIMEFIVYTCHQYETH